MKTLAIEYFAIFRDHAGTDKEILQTDADTPADLYTELTARHGFPELETVKVAINDEFGDWNTPLNEGDSVVFIPPVAGG